MQYKPDFPAGLALRDNTHRLNSTPKRNKPLKWTFGYIPLSPLSELPQQSLIQVVWAKLVLDS
ncbi:hypothetical protein GCM10011273_26910 [Asticcacaulis endophyticus]|uniref:Uncharacterized protein n=1 Tax=Asticcacaulis endophyticus TaxID=1395890 RepID=A0A918Q9M1_9CAUL|nr:hypothetical protein GCM10011273_26910 [Asticcacaulis endophyticus]